LQTEVHFPATQAGTPLAVASHGVQLLPQAAMLESDTQALPQA
jgi:hypothetical protein